MSTITHRSSPSPHVIAWADLIPVPWLNGGGVTRQILSRSLTASGEWVADADQWDVRLSIADVESAGAFSDFTGMTRILTVIEGDSITLTVDGVDEQLERFRPFAFDGGADTSAQLSHGPIRDLNLIARTGIVDATVRIVSLSSEGECSLADGQFCVLLTGHAHVWATDAAAAADAVAAVELHLFDTVVGTFGTAMTISGNGTLAVISVSDTAAPTTI